MTRGAATTAAFFACTATAAFAQQLGQGGGGVEVSVWRVIAALLFCVALAAGAIFALRHRLPAGTALFRPATDQRLRLVEQLPLGPQRYIYLVSVDGREYLALFSAQGASLTPLGDAVHDSAGVES